VIEIARDSILWSGSDIGMDESMVKSCFIKKGEEWWRKVCFEFTQWSLLHTAEFSLNFLSATTGAGAKTYKSVNMCLVMQCCRLHTCVTDKVKSYWAKLACFGRQISCHPHSFRWSHGRWLGGWGPTSIKLYGTLFVIRILFCAHCLLIYATIHLGKHLLEIRTIILCL
jgi:hypothetical protein